MIIISIVFSRCCFTSWNGRCCEFPLDHEEEKPKDAAHYSNYFSIQVTTPKPLHNQNSRQFYYKSLFDEYLDRTRVREVPIPRNQGNNYQWWAESKWVKTLLFNIVILRYFKFYYMFIIISFWIIFQLYHIYCKFIILFDIDSWIVITYIPWVYQIFVETKRIMV